jgi:cellulose synthase/poly-beta-1,6-N-acetylglucosamine synthase-like glycosyltransferase
MILIELIYAFAIIALAVYGFNTLYLVWRFAHARRVTEPEPPAPGDWPRVTVQLPIYNERHTVDRLLDAVAALDYPRDRLQVQVLDDSTDDTVALAAARVARLRQAGLDIVHLHRTDRAGFKAGALAAGLRRASGEFVAVFDADFVPPPDFLRRTLPWFAAARVGCVQTRWTHVNRDYSRLTRVQALGVDGHFAVEQAARCRSGLFLNFNGTAGVWRASAIADAGGWQHDTLTEDLDLSYRAQLRGWRIAYLPEVAVPAELPAQMDAYKRQQARWAKGTLQTARKLIDRLLRSNQPLSVKVEGVLHLTGYLVHPLILLLVLITPLMAAFAPDSAVLRIAPWLMAAAAGPPVMYLAAHTPTGPRLAQRLRLLPWMIVLGIGLSLNNGRAALAGLFGKGGGTFLRTPKFALASIAERWESSVYALPRDRWVMAEIALSLLSLSGIAIAIGRADWGFLPWLSVYAIGFGGVAWVSVTQSLRRRAAMKR